MAVILSPLGSATTPSVHDPRRGRRPGPHGGRGVGRLGREEQGGAGRTRASSDRRSSWTRTGGSARPGTQAAPERMVPPALEAISAA